MQSLPRHNEQLSVRRSASATYLQGAWLRFLQIASRPARLRINCVVLMSSCVEDYWKSKSTAYRHLDQASIASTSMSVGQASHKRPVDPTAATCRFSASPARHNLWPKHCHIDHILTNITYTHLNAFVQRRSIISNSGSNLLWHSFDVLATIILEFI